MPVCKPYDEETGEGCQALNCKECVWVRFVCEDCEKYGDCDYKYKPKITGSNRHALSMYSFACKFNMSPRSGGIYDQPAKLMTQFQIIMDEVAKQEKIQHEQEIERLKKER